MRATPARTLGLLGAAWVLLATTPGPAAAQRGLQPADYYDLVTVGYVAVAPEGDLVAFTVTRVLEEENSRRREIWMQALENGRPAGDPYSFTAPTGDSYAPRWSPDGSLLSFTSRRGDDDNTTWFVRVSGPGGEAFHIEGVRGAPVWSADGEWIAYLALAEDAETEERDGWIAPDALSNTLDPERFDGRVVTSTRYKADGTLELRPHFSANESADLYLVSAGGGVPRRLTTLPFDKSGVAWSSDGRTIYFSGDEDQDDESSEVLSRDIWAVRVTDGSVTALTPNPGSEASPSPSPDGTRLAFVFTAERGAERDLMVVDVGGGTTEVAVISLGGVVASQSSRVGGDEMDDAIKQFLKKDKGVDVGDRTAEAIKVRLGSAHPLTREFRATVTGRSLLTGLPESVEFSTREIREALEEPVEAIIDTVKVTLDRTPPELVTDILDQGIHLAGGGSLLIGLPDRIRAETGMPTRVVADPLGVVVEGAGIILENFSRYGEMIFGDDGN